MKKISAIILIVIGVILLTLFFYFDPGNNSFYLLRGKLVNIFNPQTALLAETFDWVFYFLPFWGLGSFLFSLGIVNLFNLKRGIKIILFMIIFIIIGTLLFLLKALASTHIQ